jgi:cytochrome c biogenesis protein CcdA
MNRRKILIGLGMIGIGAAIAVLATYSSWGGAITWFLGIIIIVLGLAYLIYKPLPKGEVPERHTESINDPDKVVHTAYENKESVYQDTMVGVWRGAGTDGGPVESIKDREE